MTVDPSSICQIEIPISDTKESLKFYEEVFGWKAVPIELHQYIVMETPDDCPYGISLIPSPKSKTGIGTTVYFKVKQLDSIQKKAEEFGCPLQQGRSLPGYGKVQIIKDPSGNRLGLFESKS